MKFDFNAIENFDEHINLSIPNYDCLVDQIKQYSQYFVDDHTNVYDLGCSTGKMLLEMSNNPTVNYFGVDNSKLLPSKCDAHNVHFLKEDLLEYTDIYNASLIYSIFTLQFLPKCKRDVIIKRVSDALNKNGAFIICEKTYSSNAKLQDITNSIYYEYKEKHFKVSEILNKERELRQSLRMNTLDDIMKELKVIGKAEIFWRTYNFVGIIVLKD